MMLRLLTVFVFHALAFENESQEAIDSPVISRDRDVHSYWPLKINIEPENHLFKKENHLPSTSIFLFKMFMFQGVCLTNSFGCSLGPFTVTTARDPRNILGGGFKWFLILSLLTTIEKPVGNHRNLALFESTLLFEIYWKFNWNL